VWAGAKSFTVTSGPGFSLMMEHIGYAAMTETPCVFVDVQRGGPSTGLPTLPAQGDMMQARWGSHGDYEIIALCPQSPQECFDLTVEAFNLAETYRVPVLLMMDEVVGHMTEKVVIPPAEEIELVPRRYTELSPEQYKAYRPEADGVPQMARAGAGYHFHVTGLTHDERGYPAASVSAVDAQQRLVSRLVQKIRANAAKLNRNEERDLDDAEVVVLAYGITARIALKAVHTAREQGIRVGLIRPIVAWPFPEERIRELAARPQTAGIVVAELNYGQLKLETERCVAGRVPVHLVGHGGGTVHKPEQILEAIMKAAAAGPKSAPAPALAEVGR
jgi:2-oxoglutarate ferredoxin oxidoreductase subunit alpha